MCEGDSGKLGNITHTPTHPLHTLQVGRRSQACRNAGLSNCTEGSSCWCERCYIFKVVLWAPLPSSAHGVRCPNVSLPRYPPRRVPLCKSPSNSQLTSKQPQLLPRMLWAAVGTAFTTPLPVSPDMPRDGTGLPISHLWPETRGPVSFRLNPRKAWGVEWLLGPPESSGLR